MSSENQPLLHPISSTDDNDSDVQILNPRKTTSRAAAAAPAPANDDLSSGSATEAPSSPSLFDNNPLETTSPALAAAAAAAPVAKLGRKSYRRFQRTQEQSSSDENDAGPAMPAKRKRTERSQPHWTSEDEKLQRTKLDEQFDMELSKLKTRFFNSTNIDLKEYMLMQLETINKNPALKRRSVARASFTDLAS